MSKSTNQSAREVLKSNGAVGKRDVHMFDADALVLVTDEKHALYDERVHLPVDEKLVLNMMYDPDGNGIPQGVLQVVNGQRDPETGKILITAGRQRVKAAREASKRLVAQGREPIRVPVYLPVRPSGVRSMAVMISENEGRQNDTPLGRAKKMQRYFEAGKTEEEVAIVFNIGVPSVKNHMALLEAPAAIRNAVEGEKISVSDGYKLARMDPEEAKEKLAALLEHAPKTPGKRKNANAKKAREIVTGKKDAGISKKAEDAVATDIAAWIDANYEITPSFPDLLRLLRAGKWREIRGEK